MRVSPQSTPTTGNLVSILTFDFEGQLLDILVILCLCSFYLVNDLIPVDIVGQFGSWYSSFGHMENGCQK